MWQTSRNIGQANAVRVHKFGGSSLADAACYHRVIEILKSQTEPGDMVVVSAAGKTTNALVLICRNSGEGNQEALEQTIGDLVRFQSRLIDDGSRKPATRASLSAALHADIAELRSLLQERDSERRYNAVVGFGELWSARLMAALLADDGVAAEAVDARDFLRASGGPQPEVDLVTSATLLAGIKTERGLAAKLTVVTGFIARDGEGQPITLGRNGSDYSATVLAALNDASSVTIWTDVAGVYSADPNKVPGARPLPILSLAEANELARLGNPALHTRTLQPIIGRRIRIAIRSTFSAHGAHTQIAPNQVGERGAKIVTSLEKVSVISMRTSSREKFDGAATSIRDYLARFGLLPVARHYQPDQRLMRLCFTAEVAAAAFARLRDYQAQGAFSDLTLHDDLVLVALVGDGVNDNPRHTHFFYKQLHDAPVEFVQPGEGGLSLVAVLRRTDPLPLVVNLHHGISSPGARLGVALFGVGNIGSGWLTLFRNQQHYLSGFQRMEVQLCALASADGAVVDFTGIDIDQWKPRFEQQREALGFEQLLDLLAGHPYDELVVIDATDSHVLAHQYPLLIERGFHLVSANKYPASGPLSLYREISQQLEEKACQWYNNATVGAAMPVHYLVEDLQHSGDQVQSISGALSGTLTWLLTRFDGSRPFSELIREAMAAGYTEPDPREDLTGEDVRRKLLILARAIGLDELELDDIEFVSLLEEELLEGNVSQFFKRTETLDKQMLTALRSAQSDGKVLRYIARLERGGQAHVGLEFLDPSDPLAQVGPGENLYAIHSRLYRQQPLILRGPAAGPELTAVALQSDLFRLCQYLNSR